MKQYPTREQWNELTAQEKFDFWNALFPDNEDGKVIYIGRIKEINIPVMIEFLGDTWLSKAMIHGGGIDNLKIDGLCDALWVACRSKLKNI